MASESLKLTVFSVQEVFVAVTTAAALSYAMLSTFPNQHLLPTKWHSATTKHTVNATSLLTSFSSLSFFLKKIYFGLPK